jgi:hypothetical protein
LINIAFSLFNNYFININNPIICLPLNNSLTKILNFSLRVGFKSLSRRSLRLLLGPLLLIKSSLNLLWLISLKCALSINKLKVRLTFWRQFKPHSLLTQLWIIKLRAKNKRSLIMAQIKVSTTISQLPMVQ